MVIQHEQQHCETLVATHQLRGEQALVPPGTVAKPEIDRHVNGSSTNAEVLVDGGPFVMGTSDDPWAYDNERGAHEIDLKPFFIDRFPVTNRDHLDFIAAGGYGDERLWTAAGWRWRSENAVEHPEFWRPSYGAGAYSVL